MNWSKCKFISNGTWFDKGTEAEFICFSCETDNFKAGIFKGLRNGISDEENCIFDEFTIYDECGKLL